jgi:glycosyltransferase involved in cell wall biosynthesis
VRILYVGRIHPEKGLGLLAQALRLLAARKDEETKSLRDQEPEQGREHGAEGPKDEKTKRRKDQETDWECVLVGPVAQGEGGGGEAFAEELKRQLEGLPVRFEAPVYEPEKLAKIYDGADVFVYPSVAETGESFGIAPLEAMARRVVPVVSDLAVFREYLEPGVNGMVFDHRSGGAAENLAAALRGSIGDANERERMAAAARETAERFSMAAIAERYLKLFAETLQSGR